MIPLDFVAGTHGHFVEYILNRSLGYYEKEFDPFTSIGTSHCCPKDYLDRREIVCGHWFENDPLTTSNAPKSIRIVFDQDDLLLVSSLSLLRAADLNIDNNTLHISTVEKLNNRYYADTLEKIYLAYDYLDREQDSIPRNVLREFFKFGFRDPGINGYWIKLQDMISVPLAQCFEIKFKDIYHYDQFGAVLQQISVWLERPLNTGSWLFELHSKFLSKIPFITHKTQCDDIVKDVILGRNISIPKLSLLQESYINGRLERYFQKEMPFHQLEYFTNAKDVLQYIKIEAPDL
jgi:hypothetical protein